MLKRTKWEVKVRVRDESTVMPLAEQRVRVEAGMSAAFDRLARMLVEQRAVIEGMVMERMSGVGFVDYGDLSFHKTGAELDRDALEELTDGVFYQSIREPE